MEKYNRWSFTSIYLLKNLISERRSFDATSLLTANSKYISRILNATILDKVLYISFDCKIGVTLITSDTLFNINTIEMYQIFKSIIMENGQRFRIATNQNRILVDSADGTQVTTSGYFNLVIPFEWQ